MGRALEVFWIFLKLGCTSFGGPAAHIGFFRHAVVKERGWLSDRDFGEIIALTQFLPGPASSQTSMAIGLRRAGLVGRVKAMNAAAMPTSPARRKPIAMLVWLLAGPGRNCVKAMISPKSRS
ncbi:MAG: chromate transporter, partial [Pseudomonadota bacterium]